MSLFNGKRKADPLSTRARALTAEIAALEAQIKELDTKMQQRQEQPRLRSTARPHTAPRRAKSAPLREPVFEEVDHQRVKTPNEAELAPAHYNEFGVRKLDLAGAWRRMRQRFHGPPANNSKLVNYLAAGSIQGLRPLRYEKRVVRRRVIFLTLIVLGLLWGIFAVLLKR